MSKFGSLYRRIELKQVFNDGIRILLHRLALIYIVRYSVLIIIHTVAYAYLTFVFAHTVLYFLRLRTRFSEAEAV